MTWAIRYSYDYSVVEIVKETERTVVYTHKHWGQTRCDKSSVLDWRGDEETARAIAEKLTSARAEYNGRERAANEWLAKRTAEIIAAETPA